MHFLVMIFLTFSSFATFAASDDPWPWGTYVAQVELYNEAPHPSVYPGAIALARELALHTAQTGEPMPKDLQASLLRYLTGVVVGTRVAPTTVWTERMILNEWNDLIGAGRAEKGQLIALVLEAIRPGAVLKERPELAELLLPADDLELLRTARSFAPTCETLLRPEPRLPRK